MNFIDISSWQSGLNLKDLFAKNPNLDGVIVKATGGVSGVQRTCDPWIQELIALGKPWGFYHYLDDDYRHSSPEDEAEFFVKNCANYFGAGVPILDYEEPAKSHGTAYLKRALDHVYALTGVKPVVYASLSTIYEQDFKAIAAAGYPLWLAQYANMKFTGIQETPWQSGSVKPFEGYVMHQYASTGRLVGYNGNLDLDRFYGTIDDWKRLASKIQNGSESIKKKADPQIVLDVLNDKYGRGKARARKLEAAGYDADSIQEKINELYTVAMDLIAIKKSSGAYFDCILKISGVR